VITWDGADPADAGPVVPNGSGVSGQPWTPTRIDRGSEIHVWVFTPYSAGYGDPAQLAQPLYAPRARATDQLLDHLRSMSRDDIRAALTDQVLADLVTYSPGRRIFQGPLAVAPGTGVLPPVDGLRVRFDVFREPFENGAFAAPMLAEPSLSVPTALRSGIEITWQQVNRPPAPNRFAFPEPAPIRVHPLDLVQANIVQPHVRNSCRSGSTRPRAAGPSCATSVVASSRRPATPTTSRATARRRPPIDRARSSGSPTSVSVSPTRPTTSSACPRRRGLGMRPSGTA
jgi:hypothetical protein